MAGVATFVDLVLFIVAAALVGRRPSTYAVCAMIAVVALVDIAFDAGIAAMQGSSPYSYYLAQIGSLVDAYEGFVDDEFLESMRQVAASVAGLWVALIVVGACAEVFCALILRWCIDRVRKKSAWAPFSQVDLAPACVLVLVFGIVLYTVSMLPGVPHADMVAVVAENVLVVSIVPLFVQGAAAGKGLMNEGGIGLGWQAAFGFLAVLFGFAFLVLPVLGLFDFWVNVRKLERDDAGTLRLEDGT